MTNIAENEGLVVRTGGRTLRIVERTVEQLGFDDGAVQSSIFGAVEDQRLRPCPLVTGPYLRLVMTNQADAPDPVLSAGRPPTGAIHVVSRPVSTDDEHPKGFYLCVVDGQPWLRGYCCEATYVWSPTQRLALVLPWAGGTTSSRQEVRDHRTTTDVPRPA